MWNTHLKKKYMRLLLIPQEMIDHSTDKSYLRIFLHSKLSIYQCTGKQISRVPDQNGVSLLYISCLRYPILVRNPQHPIWCLLQDKVHWYKFCWDIGFMFLILYTPSPIPSPPPPNPPPPWNSTIWIHHFWPQWDVTAILILLWWAVCVNIVIYLL